MQLSGLRVLSATLLGASLALVGCSASFDPSPVGQGSLGKIQGKVHGGQQPVVGAEVFVLEAASSAYGAASKSLLTTGAGTTSLNGVTSYYVTTAADGSFAIGGDYTCDSNQEVYLYAVGGNPGAGTNSAAGFMAALGQCPSSAPFNLAAAVPYVWMNEVTTVAAAYAFAGFAVDATHVASSGTALAEVGIANAFANARQLVNIATGVAPATVGSNGTVPQKELNSLANILAACINTSASTSAQCTTLFTDAQSSGSTGTVATDTATAAINIAHNPAANISALYGLQAGVGAPFGPALTATPNDFTVSLVFTGGGLYGPQFISADGTGAVWVGSGNGTVNRFSPLGVPQSATGYTANAASSVSQQFMAVDLSNDAWVGVQACSCVVELSPSGTILSLPETNYAETGATSNAQAAAFDSSGFLWIASASSPIGVGKMNTSGTVVASYTVTGGNEVGGLAFDGAGNLWAPEGSGPNLYEISSAGTLEKTISGGLQYSYAVAVDSAGAVWVPNFNANTVSKFTNAGVQVTGSPFSGGGLAGSGGVAVDGGGNLWTGNYNNCISEFSSAGVAISPSTGFKSTGVQDPREVAVDGSGNVWVANLYTSPGIGPGNDIVEFIGAAVPVVTPIAYGVANNMVGSRP